jgi:hypothetical protein
VIFYRFNQLQLLRTFRSISFKNELTRGILHQRMMMMMMRCKKESKRNWGNFLFFFTCCFLISIPSLSTHSLNAQQFFAGLWQIKREKEYVWKYNASASERKKSHI